MFKSLLISIIILSCSIGYAGTLVQCDDLGEGNIIKLLVFVTDAGDIELEEFYDDDSSKIRAVDMNEIATQTYPLSSYYGYTRSLKKLDENDWVISWGCGEDIPVICTENR